MLKEGSKSVNNVELSYLIRNFGNSHYASSGDYGGLWLRACLGAQGQQAQLLREQWNSQELFCINDLIEVLTRLSSCIICLPKLMKKNLNVCFGAKCLNICIGLIFSNTY